MMEGYTPLDQRAVFEVLSDSGNRRMQPRRELLRCGIFAPIFSRQYNAKTIHIILNHIIKE